MLDQILDQVKRFQAQYVCVTGGEPLAQKNCLNLLSSLCDQGYSVSLETSGALSIESIDARVCVVMDLKTPGSGEQSKNLLSNIEHLQHKDQLKFVISNHEDYLWSKDIIERLNLASKVGELLISPSYGELDLRELSSWILQDHLPVRMQLQMHKIIWQDAAGH